MFDPQLFELVRCPVTQSELSQASDDLITTINERIAGGDVRNRLNLKLEQPIEAGLVNADGSLLFSATGGIPTLIPDEAIPLVNGKLAEPPAE